MGLFGAKKSKTTTNQQTTATMTPTNPTFVTEGMEGLANKINSTFAGLDPSKLVAGANPLQQQAGNAAGSLMPSSAMATGQSLLGDAGGTTIKGQSLLDNLSSYMNPYLKDVVDTSLADYDVGAGMTRAQDQLAKAGDSTFGGSSGAIQTAISNDALTRGRGALSAGLRSDAFNTGASLSNQDAQRRQDAASSTANLQLGAGQALGNLGAQQGADARANIATQAGMGDSLRSIQNETNQGPIQALMQQIAAFSGLPLNLLTGSTATGTLDSTTKSKSSPGLTDLMGFITQNMQSAAKAYGGGA